MQEYFPMTFYPQRTHSHTHTHTLAQFAGPSQHPSPLCFHHIYIISFGFFKGFSRLTRATFSNIDTNLVRLVLSTFHIYLIPPSSLSARDSAAGDEASLRWQSVLERNSSWRNGLEKYKMLSIKKIVWLLRALSLTGRLIMFLSAFSLSLSLVFSRSVCPLFFLPHSLSPLILCVACVVISQVPCRSRTARRRTRGSTSAWRLTWKACATRPLLTYMCEVGSKPAQSQARNAKKPEN